MKELEIGGNSAKITFDHSIDTISVEKYNVYQDGKLIDSIQTEKDDGYLSYPKPGENQKI